MILISWSHSWCFSKASWFFTAVNNSLKSLYSLEIDILVTGSQLSLTHLLHSIFASGFFSSSRVSSADIVKIFTPSGEFRTEYNLLGLLPLTKYILFSTQSIIGLAAQSYGIPRTISLPGCSVMLIWIFSKCQPKCMSVGTVSQFTHSSLCFIKVSLNPWSLKGFFFTCVQIVCFAANPEFMKFPVQSLSISSQAGWLLTLTQTQKLLMSFCAAAANSLWCTLPGGFEIGVSRGLWPREPSSFLN